MWKINDCEELLKKRINHEYVTTHLEKLEQKLTSNVKFKKDEKA